MITCRVKIIRFITKISVISVCFSDRVFVPSSAGCKWSRKSVIDVGHDLGIRETVNINKLDNSETTARKIIAGINIGGARDTEVRYAGREIVDIKYQLIFRIRRKWFRLNVQLICSENRWCEFNISTCSRYRSRVSAAEKIRGPPGKRSVYSAKYKFTEHRPCFAVNLRCGHILLSDCLLWNERAPPIFRHIAWTLIC